MAKMTMMTMIKSFKALAETAEASCSSATASRTNSKGTPFKLFWYLIQTFLMAPYLRSIAATTAGPSQDI